MEQILKTEINKALKLKDEIKKNILRLALGEIQLKQSLADISSIEQQSIIRKIIKSNQETISKLTESNRVGETAILLKEIEILKEVLPEAWDHAKVHSFIKDNSLDVLSAKNEGQAIGVVMKALKAQPSAIIDPAIVKAVVIELRK